MRCSNCKSSLVKFIEYEDLYCEKCDEWFSLNALELEKKISELVKRKKAPSAIEIESL
jgi:hypothetical protein